MNIQSIRKNSKFLILLLMVSLQTVHAEDIEVFQNAAVAGSKPNVMFVFDTSDSMSAVPSGASITKHQSLKDAVTTVLNTPGMDINAGYINFASSTGRGVKFPIADIASDAHDLDADIPMGTSVKEVLINLVNSDSLQNRTPTVNGLYEAALYFRGEAPYYGKKRTFGSWDTSVTPPHYTGGGYKSWQAANPASYSGSKTIVNQTVPLGTATSSTIWWEGCRDYSASGGTNHCSGVPTPHLDCTNVSAVACTNEEVDICGPPGETTTTTYPVVSECLTGPGSATSTWFNNSSEHKCCQSADITNSECRSWKNLRVSVTSCDNPDTETQCLGGDAEYEQCDFLREYRETDDRVYISPIAQCGANMIVLLSDGAPSDNGVDYGRIYNGGNARSPYKIRQMIANGTNAVKASGDADISKHDVSCTDLSNTIFNVDPGDYQYGNCGPELVNFLSTKDQLPGVLGSTVNTYTIGFGLSGAGATESQNYLRAVAQAGNGFFAEADSTATLVTALQNAISAESSNAQSFTSLVTSVNKQTLSHNEEVYLAMFKPELHRTWIGNLKGYKLGVDGLEGVSGNPLVSADGSYNAAAQSFWSATADGGNVGNGGMLGKLIPANRNIYVNTNPVIPSGGLDITASVLESTNSALTKTLMGMDVGATDAEKSDLIDWARSQRVHDPLHSKPVVINYGGSLGKVIYSTTNQGYLHALSVSANDTTGGDELFAFMPYHLIGNLQAMQTNSTTGDHIYGIDGEITAWVVDDNKDGEISGVDDHVYLYFGQRRGGDHFYALDVTDPASPELMWRLDAGTSNYAGLGQSWSRMSVVTVDDGGSARKVLVFTGGYDTAEDTVNTARANNSTGLGVYIIDAESGDFLASIGPNTTDYTVGNAAMSYAIPSGVKAIDSNGNGVADRLYFGDMGGQVWRIDITEAADITVAGTFSVTRLADFGGNTAATHRRFYYAPSVSRLKRHNGSEVLSIAMGSGYRSHPLNKTIEERFYTIFDSNAGIGAPGMWLTLSESDLYDATANLMDGADPATELSSLSGKSGWRISLQGAGEKVLAKARTIDGEVFFTTYEPSASSCGVNGISRLYSVELNDASKRSVQGDSGTSGGDAGDGGDGGDDSSCENESRCRGLSSNIIIPPELQRIVLPCAEEGCTQDCVGTDCQDGPQRKLKNLFWREER